MRTFNTSIDPLDFLGIKIKKATANQLKKAGVSKTYAYRDSNGNFYTKKSYQLIKDTQAREARKARSRANAPKKAATKAKQQAKKEERKGFLSGLSDFFSGFSFEESGFSGAYSLSDSEKQWYAVLNKIDDFQYLTRNGKMKVIMNLSSDKTQAGSGMFVKGGLWSKRNNVGFKEVLEYRVLLELNRENGLEKGSLLTKQQAEFMAKKLEDWHIAQFDFASIYGSDVV